MELEALESVEGDCTLERRDRLVSVPGMDAGEAVEAARVGGTGVGDQLEGALVHLRPVRDRHHDGRRDARLVHPANAELRIELPPECGNVVDVHVCVDDHPRSGSSATGRC
jgi:hypothetical protein